MSPAWRVRAASPADYRNWAQLRNDLWPSDSLAEQVVDIGEFVNANGVGFLAQDDNGVLVGFAEASLRNDYVNGTESSPVAFLEGWFVAEPWRRRGVGRALVAAVEDWARAQDCSELASDAQIDNLAGQAAHQACGLVETERVVYFRKSLAE